MVLNEFEVDEETATRDVENFINELSSINMIEL